MGYLLDVDPFYLEDFHDSQIWNSESCFQDRAIVKYGKKLYELLENYTDYMYWWEPEAAMDSLAFIG